MPAPRSRPAVPAGAVLALTLLLAWWTKARCLLTEPSWDAGEEYLRWCYTDIYPLWWAERLNIGAIPYLDHPVEYPVLTGAWMLVANGIATLAPPQLRGQVFLHVTMAMGAAMLGATFVLLRRAGLPDRRLLWFAAAPTLVVYAFMNWDPLPVVLATAAVVLHLRRRDAAAGVAAGLGAAAKLYPALVVPLFVLARLRERRPAAALATAAAAAGAWLAVNVPVLAAAPQGWARFLELSRTRPADHDSLYRIVEVYLRGDRPFDVPTLNLVTAVLFVAAAAAVLLAGVRRRNPEDTWELFLPLLIAFLLTSKVYSPQFSLWLLPLLALTLPRLTPFVVFCVADLAVFLVRFRWLGGRQGLLPAPGFPAFAAAILLRDATLVWIAWVTVRQRPMWLARRSATTTGAAEAPTR